MVRLLGPVSQISRYSLYTIYQCPNDGVHARGGSGSYRRPFYYNFGFFVDNCQALLTDQMDSFGITAWFDKLCGKLSTKNTIKSNTLTAVGRLISPVHIADGARYKFRNQRLKWIG